MSLCLDTAKEARPTPSVAPKAAAIQIQVLCRTFVTAFAIDGFSTPGFSRISSTNDTPRLRLDCRICEAILGRLKADFKLPDSAAEIRTRWLHARRVCGRKC